MKELAKSVALLIGGSGVAMAIAFATTALNIRAVGAEGVGAIMITQSAASLLQGFYSFGTQQPIIKLGVNALLKGEKEELAAIALTGWVLDGVSAILASVTGIVLVEFVFYQTDLVRKFQSALELYAICLILTQVSAAGGIFRLFGKFHFVSIFQIINALLLFLTSLLLDLTNAQTATYIKAYAVTTSILALTQMLVAANLLSNETKGTKLSLSAIWRKCSLTEFKEYAWTSNLTGTINTIKNNLDTILIGSALGHQTSAYLGVSKQLAGVLNKASDAISIVVFPEIASLAATRALKAAQRLRDALMLLGVLPGVVFIAGIHLYGNRILVYIYGVEFIKAQTMLSQLAVATAVNLSVASLGGFVQVFVSPVYLLRIYLVSIIAYLITLTVLMKFSAGNIAVAQVVFAVSIGIISWISLQKKWKKS